MGNNNVKFCLFVTPLTSYRKFQKIHLQGYFVTHWGSLNKHKMQKINLYYGQQIMLMTQHKGEWIT